LEPQQADTEDGALLDQLQPDRPLLVVWVAKHPQMHLQVDEHRAWVVATVPGRQALSKSRVTMSLTERLERQQQEDWIEVFQMHHPHTRMPKEEHQTTILLPCRMFKIQDTEELRQDTRKNSILTPMTNITKTDRMITVIHLWMEMAQNSL
jgi:hypothetical protein